MLYSKGQRRDGGRQNKSMGQADKQLDLKVNQEYFSKRAIICTQLSISRMVHSSAKCIFPLFAWRRLPVFRVSAKTTLLPHFPASTFLLSHASKTEHQLFPPIKERITTFQLPQQVFISYQTEKAFLIAYIWY